MAHMIENNQLAYAGATPWHGLGVEVPRGTTGAEMLQLAGLNWRVQRRHLAMRDGTGNRATMLTEELASYRAIVRADTSKVFQIATTKYQPVQNSAIVEFFREFCEAGHATMETVGALRDGGVVWALARLNGGSTSWIGAGTTQMDFSAGDELRGYMLLATSHDGSMATVGMPTQVRVVCHNTLSAAVRDAKHEGTRTFTLRHSSKFDEAQRSRARSIMGMALEQVQEVNQLAAKLAAVTIDESGWLDFMSRLMGGQDKVLDPKTMDLTTTAREIQQATMTSPGSNLPSARGTLWGALNGVTYWTDHVAASRSQQNRLWSAWFGDRARLKAAALEAAQELAGVSV